MDEFDNYYNLMKAKIEAKDFEQNEEYPTKKPQKEKKLSQREIFYTGKNKTNTK
jgi:hypothetical protein